MADYQIIYQDDAGNDLLQLTEWSQLEYTRVVNDIGACVLTLPLGGAGTDIESRLHRDYRLSVWRKSETAWQFERWYFLRAWEISQEEYGDHLKLIALDPNYLLQARIADPYYDLSAIEKTNMYATQMMRQIVNEHLGAGAVDSARNWTNRGFSIEPERTEGPVLSHSFAGENVLKTLQTISDMSADAGQRVYFDVVCIPPSSMEFQTFIGLRGVDKSDRVILAHELGNLRRAVLRYDYADEKTRIICGAGGSVGAMFYARVTDDERVNQSLWGLREEFLARWDINDPTQVWQAAGAELELKRPRLRLEATIEDLPASRYGIDWRLGDKVTVVVRGRWLAGAIESIRVTAKRGSDGRVQDSVQSKIEVDEVLGGAGGGGGPGELG